MNFITDVVSATADKGLFRFTVDGVDILDIDDGGLEVNGDITLGVGDTVDGVDVSTLLSAESNNDLSAAPPIWEGSQTDYDAGSKTAGTIYYITS